MSARSVLQQRLSVPARGAGSYLVTIGRGLLDRSGELLGAAEAPAWGIISDARVGPLYAERVRDSLRAQGAKVSVHIWEGGEEGKRWPAVQTLQEALIEAGLHRDGRVVALGGGVVGDVAGFVAATLFRGLGYAQVPTTLLAMVDSSIGGKTGIDTESGKNLVGAFHHPLSVLDDVGVLDTLPEEEMRAGLAEVIKYGVILDEQLFVDLEDGLLESCVERVEDALVNVVQRCVTLKARVVQEDPEEANLRQVLNFGHTVGHAIEAASQYRLRHGEAVAIGMVAEAGLACDAVGAMPDLPERIRALCERAGLPVRLPEGLSDDAVAAAASSDKKVRDDRLRCVLPRAIGSVSRDEGGSWSIAITRDQLHRAVARILDA